MPRQEFIDLVNEIKKSGKSKKITIREFLWLFDYYEKRTSGNIWRINTFLHEEKMVTTPNYQNGWIDWTIELKELDKVKIKNGNDIDKEEQFDAITRLSVIEASTKTPVYIPRDAKLEKAYHLMWTNDFSQLPVMNNDREILGVISWQNIAKGLIAKKESDCVKDFMTNDYVLLPDDKPLFDGIKQVIKHGVVFVIDKEKKIKGPITPFDLNEEFIEQIEPFILLEQIENFIRLILDNKIPLKDIHNLLTIEDKERKIESISDMTFGEYLKIIQNNEMWSLLKLPFVRSDFFNELDEIRKIRNGVMHFHPDRISSIDLKKLRKMSAFLMDYMKNC